MTERYQNEPETDSASRSVLDAICWISVPGGVDVVRMGDPSDFVFVLIWAAATLLLVAYYCYRMTQR